MQNNKIVDCFIFHNELDMLKFRLKELYDVVDYFVLVESTKTFTNADKKTIF
jgi:beta-1,4-mannosyl-glycoprotein beta-1,4-N-acetylglucosaminyltransferase